MLQISTADAESVSTFHIFFAFLPLCIYTFTTFQCFVALDYFIFDFLRLLAYVKFVWHVKEKCSNHVDSFSH